MKEEGRSPAIETAVSERQPREPGELACSPAEPGFKGVALSPHLQITSPELATPRGPETRFHSPANLLPHVQDRCGVGAPNWEAGDPGILPALRPSWDTEESHSSPPHPPSTFTVLWRHEKFQRVMLKNAQPLLSGSFLPEWESGNEFHALRISVWLPVVEV